MRNQGWFRPYPKTIQKIITVEGNKVAKVTAEGILGSSLVIPKEVWIEIGNVMDWRTERVKDTK